MPRSRLSPVSNGVELALAQRQAVHAGWDIPKPVTFERFFRSHLEWKDMPPVEGRFHWKWYYAMHQAGDGPMAGDVAQYRASLRAREEWTARVELLLAPVNIQVLLRRLADSGLAAQLAYQERAMTAQDIKKLPVFQNGTTGCARQRARCQRLQYWRW